MVDLKGTKTAENLMKSFAGESQARMRYTYYAEKAKQEGLEQIAEIFIETAENEKEHARIFFNFLVEGLGQNQVQEIQAGYPVALGSTEENLISAANGENEEWTELYPEFAKIAEEEGFKQIAQAYKLISSVEEKHEIRYKKLAKQLKEDSLFKKDGKVFWKCRVCGYITEFSEAPKKCPVCKAPQGYFELFVENY